MLERDVERRLVQMTRCRGGLALKFVSPGTDGVPDRLVLLPDARMAFHPVHHLSDRDDRCSILAEKKAAEFR